MGEAAPGGASGRLPGAARRDSLVDAAAGLVNDASVDAVTMESVAERAGVSRPLVYKHFANRDEILAAVYQREADLLHAAIAREVAAAPSTEEMFRALIHAALQATQERGPLFASLRQAGGWNRQVGRTQRTRDADTARAFTRRAVAELGLDRREAGRAIALLLGLIDPALAQFRARPTAASAREVERAYMTIVSATLRALPRSDDR